MVQVFRDSYRARKRDGRIGSLARLWLRTSIDLILSAVKEHTEKENLLMSNLKKHLVALSGCVVVIVGSIALLTYGRKHEVSSILAFGYFLDAVATTGILGNLVIFILATTTRLRSLRVVVTTFLVVHVALLFVIFLISRSDPHFNVSGVSLGYVTSFLFWVGLHWTWSKTMPATASANS